MTRTPDRYRYAAIPHLVVKGAATAIEFYERAFGAVELFRVATPSGHIVHGEIQVGGATLMIGDPGGPDILRDPKDLGGASAAIHIYVDDVDAVIAKAIESGATEIEAPHDMFYGDRTGVVADPFGHVWVFLTHLEDVEPADIQRRGAELLSQAHGE
jgi:PhnB protein